MVLEVYLDMMSQPCRALYMFLAANRIPYQTRLVRLREGEHLKEEFKAVSPIQRVPVINNGGFKLTESIAIYRYLNSLFGHGIADHWYPHDLQCRARVDEFLEWQHLNLRAFASMVFRARVLSGIALDSEKMARHKQNLEEVLKLFEGHFIKDDTKFVNGLPDISVADLVAVTELEQPLAAGYNLGDEHPGILAYMKRVRAAIGPEIYDSAHKICHTVRDRVQEGKI